MKKNGYITNCVGNKNAKKSKFIESCKPLIERYVDSYYSQLTPKSGGGLPPSLLKREGESIADATG